MTPKAIWNDLPPLTTNECLRIIWDNVPMIQAGGNTIFPRLPPV